jgi:hypothetical protein
MSEETVTFNLELNTEILTDNLRQLERLAYRALGLLQRFGLPEDVNQAVEKIQRLVMTIRLLHSAIIMLQTASGPIGWALALTAVGSAAFSIGDTLSMMEARK